MPFCRSLFRCLALRTWLFLIILFHSIQVGNITHDYVRRTITQVSLTTPRARGQLKNVGAMVCAPFEKLGFREPWIPSKILKEVPEIKDLIKSCKMHDPKGYGMTDCDPTMFRVSRFLTQHSVCYVFDNNDKKTFGTFSSHHVFYGGGPPILWSLRLEKSWLKLFKEAEKKTIRFDVYLFASGSKFPSVSGPSTTHDMTLKTRTNRATNKTEVKTVEKGSFAVTYQPTVFTRLESPKETACKNYSAEGKFESQEECLHHCIRDGIRSKKELTHDNITPLLFRLNDTSNNDRIYGNSDYKNESLTRTLDDVFRSCKENCPEGDCVEEGFPSKVMSFSDHDSVDIEVRAANHPIFEVKTEPKLSHMEYIGETANTFSFWWGFSPREILKEHVPWVLFFWDLAVCYLGLEAISIAIPPPGVEGQPPRASPARDVEAGEPEMASREQPVAGPSGAVNTEPKGGLQPSGFMHTTRGTCIDHIEDQSQHNFEALEAASKDREEMKAEMKTSNEEMKNEMKTLKEELTVTLQEECAVNLEAAKVELKQSMAELDDGFTKTINEQVDKTNANFEELKKANASLALETKKLSARCRDIHERTKHLKPTMKLDENNDSVIPLIQPCIDQVEKLVTKQAILEQSVMEAKQLNQKHLERIAVLEHSLANQPSIQPYVDRIATLEQSLANQANQPSIQACLGRIATLEASIQPCLDRIAQLEASASNPCRADLRVQLLQDSVLRLSRVIRNIQPRPPTF